MTTKHTPGPWYYESKAPHTILATGNEIIASAMYPGDACLIAAAPNLLDGCNALLGLLQLLCARDDAPFWLRAAVAENHRVAEAQAAVAKATQP